MTASRFHDGHRGATHTARIAIHGPELRILGADNIPLAAWPVAQVKAAPEMDPDGAVRLTVGTLPGALLVDDVAELAVLRAAGIRLPRHRAWTGRHWTALTAGMAAVAGVAVLAFNTLPGVIASMIPTSWEQRLGAPSEALIAGSTRHCTGPEGQAALDRLVARLRTAGAIELPVTLIVLDDKLVNAFTLPGGQVLVMRGLIAAAEDGPELAGVIAHELGHVAHHDSTTMLIRGLGLSVLLNSLGLGDTAGEVVREAGNLLTLSYGRAAETAADDAAISVLTAAGLRADGLSRFFAHMERAPAPEGKTGTETGDRDGNDSRDTSGNKNKNAKSPASIRSPPLTWLSTHPASAERGKRTARPATGEMPFTETEWVAIRGMCREK